MNSLLLGSWFKNSASSSSTLNATTVDFALLFAIHSFRYVIGKSAHTVIYPVTLAAGNRCGDCRGSSPPITHGPRLSCPSPPSSGERLGEGALSTAKPCPLRDISRTAGKNPHPSTLPSEWERGPEKEWERGPENYRIARAAG